MISSLFRKKSIAQIQADAAAGFSEHDQDSGQPGTLRRTLGVFDLTLMGIAAIIGAGIFAMVGQGVVQWRPRSRTAFYFYCDCVCVLRLSAMRNLLRGYRSRGRRIHMLTPRLGEFIAWIIGWDLIVEYAIGNIAVAISWSDYFTGLLERLRDRYSAVFHDGFSDRKTWICGRQEAVAAVQTVDVLAKACDAKDAVVSCGQMDAYSAWPNAPHLGSIPIVATCRHC